MCSRLISLILTSTLIAFGIAVTTSACACSNGAAAINAASSSNCGSSGSGGNPAPKPTNPLVADCTANLQGPDNFPGTVTASIEFTCIVDLEHVTLAISIWHSGAGGGQIGDKPEKSNVCESIISGACSVTVPCTPGTYLASYSLTAVIEGQLHTLSDQSQKFTYSAGDCTV